MGAGGLPLLPRQRLQAQYAAQRLRNRRDAAAQGRQQQQQQEEDQGAVAGAEGLPPQPLDVQGTLNELVGMLQRVLDFLPAGVAREGDSSGYNSSSSSRAEDT